MVANYTTPLARWARLLEIFIPCYMFGKSWGIADKTTVELFRAMFPSFLVEGAESIKALMQTDNTNLQLFMATVAGAIIGILVVAALAVAMHFVLRDRTYINSLRFTAVTLIPVAVLNGTLSHAIKTLVENLGSQDPAVLYTQTVSSSRGNFALDVTFYLTAMWMMGRRTGVRRSRRWGVITVGVGFMILYLALGLMITPGEWQELLPKLQQALAIH